MATDNTHTIAVLPGDGIGPEIMDAALHVLGAVSKKHGMTLKYLHADVGGAAYDRHGTALPEETLKACEAADAILLGAVGGPKWDSLPDDQKVERTSLLRLRKHFDLFANFRPAVVYPQLASASPLKPSIVGSGFDILIVRELSSDAYFGKRTLGDEEASDMMTYRKHEAERVAKVAFEAARKRKKKVTCVDKANVLASSILFRRYVTEVSRQYPDITLEFMYVDNASMQLIKNPHNFDVIVTTNMFGDILSDEAAMLTGSIGLLASASLNGKSFGMYEPAHGSAPRMAGKGIANPVAQIMSAAMMFTYSFSRPDIHASIERAVMAALGECRTKDVMEPGKREVSTQEMGKAIARHV
ncbi:TPA: 3-isopropylmalate dehydrogenase [Candidatus Woesearchaeota archaeon]|nr:3-isopropylmalate dehydrogenase [Candidatus Woesearchaeota archaeon]HIH91817.1 3-isopropylmalate dehydrogenase [Candidatus Woesearchaeota archaeon]HII64257.1 3-isopropylmalate dehydrogenase [Candidatus Woesearchaeota archaeon]HII66117.1 3-isopropylmalate dehydrogenase [Candidatus Woesearchaeota archaeon]HIJ18746.1 3-isopropylmalate dehydrogenase [Candidatus Woesearchaeota archaeon]